MNQTVVYAIASLSGIGIVAAVILYITAQKFKVKEDPKVEEVHAVLPQVNCGACGQPGCHQFAEACVLAEDLSKLYCPVGGSQCMMEVARIVGKELVEKAPMVAVVRCNGTYQYRPKTNVYDSARTCAISSYLYGGETPCAYGCLGFGDCVAACRFGAMYMDEQTGLPVVIEENCTSCGACVKACPKGIIELRKKGPKSRRIFVCCINKDKGGAARKSCQVACIGCGRCVKECPFEAITLKDNLAYIDFEKCKLCRKCVAVCPTHAIHELNFPPKSEKKTETDTQNEKKP